MSSLAGHPRGNTSCDQPPPRIHGSSGCVRAYVAIDSRYASLVVEVVLVALQHVDATAHRVHVRVLEPGHEHATGEVDDVGAVADQVADLVVGADRDDGAVIARRPRAPTIGPHRPCTHRR